MRKEEFGKLVAVLRKEHTDVDGLPWKQSNLATETNLSHDLISRIERGKKEHIKPNTLIALADAFKLTSGERREFFLAASGISSEEIARHEHDPKNVLLDLVDRGRKVSLPAYIIDSYCDIVATNRPVVELLDIESAGLSLNEAMKIPFGLNMLQFVFSDNAVHYYRDLMSHLDWQDYAYQNMMIFRTLSLQYRNTEYFQNLLRHLMKYPEFKHYWSQVYYYEKDHVVNNEHIKMNSPKWGSLVYFSTSFTALTSSESGNLHFCVYIPANSFTATAFDNVIEECVNTEMTVLTPKWPEKR